MMFFSKQNQSYIAISSRVSIIIAVVALVVAYLLMPAMYKSVYVLRVNGAPPGYSYSQSEEDLKNFVNNSQNLRKVGDSLAKTKFFVGKNKNDGLLLSYKLTDKKLSEQRLTEILNLYKSYIKEEDSKRNVPEREYVEEGPETTRVIGSVHMALLWALLAGFAAFMITMGIFLIARKTSFFSKKLKNPKIVAQRTGLEVMGVIPKDDLIEADQNSQQIKNKLLYHMLLSVLQNTKVQQQRILITSIYPEEGKEFVSNVICEWLFRKGKQCLIVVPYFDGDHWWLKHQNENEKEKITVELLAKKDVIIMVLPPLITGELPIELIRDFDMAYLVCNADREWSPKDQTMLDYFMDQSEHFLQIILNRANMNVVEEVLKQIDVTYFASADRSSQRTISREHKAMMNSMQVNKIMKDVPNLGVILDKNRQIVYANEAITSLLGLSNMDKTIGMRPGELVSCVYSDVTSGGCGTSKACQDCGAVNTILKCLKSKKHEEGTCTINSFLGGQLVPFNFKISCSPFQAKDGDFFVIANLAEIKGDEEKRKELVEKTKKSATASKEQLSALNEFIDKVDDSGQFEALLDTIKGNEETIEFRRLISAENGTLKMQPDRHSAFVMLENAVRSVRERPYSKNREITLAPPFPSVYVITDAVIFEQILRTMLRNALEAEPDGGVVYIGYEQTEKWVTFYVFNKTPIPQELQERVFEKGFTTKVSRRGLGTYSLQVLGERYLQGNVGFKSSNDGTHFYMTLPVSI